MTEASPSHHRDFRFDSEFRLREFAADFALALKCGDCVLLKGDLGAGKTTFARAAIRTLAGDTADALEVPSPTFTLVQNYELRLPVAHLDLYRVADPDELEELGLEDALAAGVAFVEWPEKGADRLPANAVLVAITESPREPDSREVRVMASENFLERLDRSLAMRGFLETHGYRDAKRAFLLGDASARAYETVVTGLGETLILMNAPRTPDGPPVRDGKPYSRIAHLAEDVTPFVAIAEALRNAGFRAPRIHASDLEAGFVLLEHLGNGSVLDPDRRPIMDRYEAAVEMLAAMHRKTWPEVIGIPQACHEVPEFDRGAFMIEVELLSDWFVPRATGEQLQDEDCKQFLTLWVDLFEIVQAHEKTLVLRDFHSPNIIWDGSASGTDRIGLIDFQDALIGSTAYDVASLAQDARVDVPTQLQDRLLDRYCALRAEEQSFDEADFRRCHAILVAQRTTKILGIFVRLDERDGKPGYLAHIPRLQAYLRRVLSHPDLAALSDWYNAHGILDAQIGGR